MSAVAKPAAVRAPVVVRHEACDCKRCPLRFSMTWAFSKLPRSATEAANVKAIFILEEPEFEGFKTYILPMLAKLEINFATEVAIVNMRLCLDITGSHEAVAKAEEACGHRFDSELENLLKTTPVEAPVILLGHRCLKALRLGDHSGKLGAVRGYSYWRDERRFIPTYAPVDIELDPTKVIDVCQDLENALFHKVECPVVRSVMNEQTQEAWVKDVKQITKALEERNPPKHLLLNALRKLEAKYVPPYKPLLKQEIYFELITTAQGVRDLHVKLSQGYGKVEVAGSPTGVAVWTNPLREYVIDIETGGFNPYTDELILIAIGVSENFAYVITEQVFDVDGQVAGFEADESGRLTEVSKGVAGGAAVRELLNDASMKWVLHNAKFDFRWLRVWPTIKASPVVAEDTLLLHYVLEERIGTHGLKELSRRYLGLPDYEAELHAVLPKKASSYRYIPRAILNIYAARDVAFTFKLLRRLRIDIELQNEDYCETTWHGPQGDLKTLYRFLIDAENALIEIEENGLAIDLQLLEKTNEEFLDEIHALNKALLELVGPVPPLSKTSMAKHVKELKTALTPVGGVGSVGSVGGLPFNPKSSKQVQWAMYDKFRMPAVRLFRNHKDRSSSKEAMEKILKELVEPGKLREILSAFAELPPVEVRALIKVIGEKNPDIAFLLYIFRLREVSKLHSTYIKGIRENTQEAVTTLTGEKVNLLHPDYRLHGTVTGRLATSRPNLLAIPRPSRNVYAKQIRSFFKARPGHVWVSADYASAEVRVATEFAREPYWRDQIIGGLDMHATTCCKIFNIEHYDKNNKTHKEMRMVAKMLVFGLLYGRGAKSIATERQIPIETANKWISDFFEVVPNVKKWLDGNREFANDYGYVRTPVGRVRRFGFVNDANRFKVGPTSVNMPVQGTASDCCLWAFIRMHNWLKETGYGYALLFVHDAIELDVKVEHVEEVKAKLKEFMLEAPKALFGASFMAMGVDINVGLNWGEA